MPLLTRRRVIDATRSFSGQTTLFGKVRRAERGRVELILGDGTAVELCGKTAGIDRDLGEIGLDGLAIWDAVTNSPIRLRVARVIRLHSPARAFECLALATGTHWDGASPETHLRRLRGDFE